MIFLRPLGHIDIWALSVWLYRERGSLRDGRRIRLIDGNYRHPNLDKWATVKNTIARGRRVAGSLEFDLISAEIEQLDAGASQAWEKSDGDDIEVHVGIVTNPGAVLYCGNEGISVAAGQVVARGLKQWHSAINISETPRVHLVLCLRQRVIEEGESP